MRCLETPVELGEMIYVRDLETHLYAIDKNTCEVEGTMTVQQNNSALRTTERSPIVVEDLLIVPFGDQRVFAYRP